METDNFNNDGVFQVTDSLTISEVLNDEAVYNLDLDDDGNIGDTVSAIHECTGCGCSG